MDKMLIDSPSHHVAVCGRVAIGYQEEGQSTPTILSDPVPHIRVEIINAPPSFQRRRHLQSLSHGQQWDALPKRLDRTQTAIDGSFHFIDLPPGDYTLKATCFPRSTYLQEAKVVVTVVDGKQPESKELVLATTGIIGQVTTRAENSGSGQSTNLPEEKTKTIPVAYAQVRLKGGKEKTRCDRDGNFQLLNLEAPEFPSTRLIQLQISAPGYDLFITNPIALSRGTVHSTFNIQLTKKLLTKANGTST